MISRNKGVKAPLTRKTCRKNSQHKRLNRIMRFSLKMRLQRNEKYFSRAEDGKNICQVDILKKIEKILKFACFRICVNK